MGKQSLFIVRMWEKCEVFSVKPGYSALTISFKELQETYVPSVDPRSFCVDEHDVVKYQSLQRDGDKTQYSPPLLSGRLMYFCFRRTVLGVLRVEWNYRRHMV